MARRNSNTQQFQRLLTEKDFESIRPATVRDKWCRIRECVPDGKAPYGYVVTIPAPNNNVKIVPNFGVENYHIIRCKKHCNKLLLQIVPSTRYMYPRADYGVASGTRDVLKKKKGKRQKKTRRILNVRNLNKIR